MRPALLALMFLSNSTQASELDDTVAALRAVAVTEETNTVVPVTIVALEARFKRLLRDEAIRERRLVDKDGQVALAALKPALDDVARHYAPADDGDGAYRAVAIY